MHDTRVEMVDGRVFIGPIYLFRPELGFMTLIIDPSHYDYEVPEKFFFRDMRSATTENQRITISRTSTEDELQRARKQGWDGT